MKDIDEIRRQNIAIIEKELGSAAIYAKLLDMSYAQYVNLRDGAKDSKTGKPRGMRKQTARRFEEAGNKPAGWLDIDHSTPLVKHVYDKRDDVDGYFPRDGKHYPFSVREPEPTEWVILNDYRLLLGEDQERIMQEVKRLADIARAYRKKFGETTADNERVAKAIPPAPSHHKEKQ